MELNRSASATPDRAVTAATIVVRIRYALMLTGRHAVQTGRKIRFAQAKQPSSRLYMAIAPALASQNTAA